MSVLSDEQLLSVYELAKKLGNASMSDRLRAVADAAIAADRAARAEPVGFVDANGDFIPQLKLQPWTKLYTAPPAAPVVPNEEGKHCGDPDCVPCRDPAEPAAPIVPECPFPCGWRKLYELMMRDAAWVSSQLQAYPDEPLPEHLPQIVFVNHDRALRVVRAMLAAHEAKRASCSQAAKKSTREGGRVNETEKSEQVAEAVKAERERIYALIDTNPEHIWRDAGFMQWRAKRSQESE